MAFTLALFGYLGPETMLPMTSVLAGVVGVVMMFGRNSVRWVVGSIKAIGDRSKSSPRAAGQARRIGARPAGGVARAAATKAQVAG